MITPHMVSVLLSYSLNRSNSRAYLPWCEGPDGVEDESDDWWGDGDLDGVQCSVDAHGWFVQWSLQDQQHGERQENLYREGGNSVL